MICTEKRKSVLLKVAAAILSVGLLCVLSCKTEVDSSDGDSAGSENTGGGGIVLVSGIEIKGGSAVAVNGSLKLSVSVTPSSATQKSVDWTSADELIATVQSGVVTGLSAGTVVVRAAATDSSTVFTEKTITVVDVAAVTGAIEITESGGWLESAYIEWKPADTGFVDGYRVYVREIGGEYAALDGMLVREYAGTSGTAYNGTYYRADAPGLAAGNYQMKVVGLQGNLESEIYSETGAVEVAAHDRSGFAFTGSTVPGAYKEDGTLKDGTIVLYVTKDTVSTVSYTAEKGKNSAKSAVYTGLQEVLSEASLKNLTVPLCVRLIGTISSNEFTSAMWGSSSEGLQIKNTSEYGLTVEGIGEDATIRGFGILCRSTNYVELRNFAVMNCIDDSVSLDTANLYSWVHNLDLFYGAAGSDSDQAKGDGTVDVKGDSQFQTYSYNHFWDSGKSSLCGMKSETGPNYITYHHNWFDHSDSRHPRVRTMSVHVYNNYYDGISKYGVGVTTGADAFVEANYFRNCKFPMLSSLQGNDIYAGTGTQNSDYATFSKEAGGSIKAFNNHIEGTTTSYWPYQDTGTAWTKGSAGSIPAGIDAAVQFDAYEVASRTDTVPATVVAVNGGDTYSNFDTDRDLGVDASAVESPEQAKATVERLAGRMNGGDFRWDFDDATEDTNYSVITALKDAINSYTSALVSVPAVSSGSSTEDSSGGESGDSTGDTSGSDGDGSVAASGTVVVFDTFVSGTAINGVTVTGNLKSNIDAKTYNGVTYTTALKMEGSTSITFVLETGATLTLITDTASKKIKIDGAASATDADGVVTAVLAAGSHTVAKGDVLNLYALCIVPQ